MSKKRWSKLSKKVLVCVPLLATISGVLPSVSAEEASEAAVFDAGQFTTWVEEEGTWRTVVNSNEEEGIASGFIEDESGKPTEEDLEEILHLASLGPTSGGKTDWYLVVVTDPAEQLKIIGDNYGRATSEGTVTVLVFAERLIRDELRTDTTEEDTGSRFSPDRGYYNAGIVSGYLNLAAISKGYGTHFFMSPDLPGNNGFDDGSRGQDAYAYLEGTEYYDAQLQEHYSTENMKFVNAIVIGTPNEEIEAGVTMKEYPDNWSFFTETTEDVEVEEEVEEEVVEEEVAEEDVEETEEDAEETEVEDSEEETDVSENGVTLTGEAEGLNGPVVVEVVVDGDTIVSVTVVEQEETVGVADKALSDVPQAIVDNNGVEGVEVVTGATVTSEAIIEAVQNALASQE